MAEKRKQVNLGLMGAGGMAGVVSKTVVAPFERVKIVCQTGASSEGMVATTRRILATEGVLGFWRGNWAACVRILPHKAVLFGWSDIYRSILSTQTLVPIAPSQVGFFAGAWAGTTACILTYPLDFIRTRLAGKIESLPRHSSMLQAFVVIVREEGARALFRGMGPTLLGSIPYEGIKFGSYDILRGFLPDGIDPKADFAGKMVCGGGAGMIATLLTYPNDTVRRRMQMQGIGGNPRLYKHTVDCYIKLAKAEGIKSYYRGLTPTLVRAMPNMGIQFACYDIFRSWLPKQ
ncbi:Mitochondrial Carrier (MC) Family [Achlya hypogyna]|uniref:Mitochondrial Carrier (MC) Family n=1 Tax=Achlya hypogyna TaxID=1202772 RepID=A0A1V9ZR86_ACHHY|nr:Mitochondrial Carrier (MC) Family [Achlya hypogyna]